MEDRRGQCSPGLSLPTVLPGVERELSGQLWPRTAAPRCPFTRAAVQTRTAGLKPSPHGFLEGQPVTFEPGRPPQPHSLPSCPSLRHPICLQHCCPLLCPCPPLVPPSVLRPWACEGQGWELGQEVLGSRGVLSSHTLGPREVSEQGRDCRGVGARCRGEITRGLDPTLSPMSSSPPQGEPDNSSWVPAPPSPLSRMQPVWDTHPQAGVSGGRWAPPGQLRGARG